MVHYWCGVLDIFRVALAEIEVYPRKALVIRFDSSQGTAYLDIRGCFSTRYVREGVQPALSSQSAGNVQQLRHAVHRRRLGLT